MAVTDIMDVHRTGNLVADRPWQLRPPDRRTMIPRADLGPPTREMQTDLIRVFILDDHELVRRGLQELLEGEGFQVVGSSGSAVEATRRIPALHPDVSVLDARLPDGTGIEVCRDVRSVDSRLNCLILTSFDDEQALRGAVLAGARGYVLKEIGGTDLIGAMRRAAAGESLFDDGVAASIVESLVAPQQVDPRIAGLTPQERRVLELVGGGLTNRQIAGEMFLAEKTVKNYVSSLLAKLGFERRTQAAVYIANKVMPAPSPAAHSGMAHGAAPQPGSNHSATAHSGADSEGHRR